MTVSFHLSENCDDPVDPESWTFINDPLPGSYATLTAAVDAAVARALLLADDPYSDVFSVDIAMAVQEQGGRMGLMSMHVWWDHAPHTTWLTALRDHIAEAATPAA